MPQPRAEPRHMTRGTMVILTRAEPALAHRNVVAAITDRILREHTAHQVTLRPSAPLRLRGEHRGGERRAVPMEDPDPFQARVALMHLGSLPPTSRAGTTRLIILN